MVFPKAIKKAQRHQTEPDRFAGNPTKVRPRKHGIMPAAQRSDDPFAVRLRGRKRGALRHPRAIGIAVGIRIHALLAWIALRGCSG